MNNECIVCHTSISTKAKTCSPKCRKLASRSASVTKNGVSVTKPRVEQESVTFEFTVTYKPLNNFDESVVKEHGRVRKAKYWYDVPLAAVPVLKDGWPKMPDYMNGRQYFLWWKNDFKTKDGIPVIFNPF